MSTTPPPDPRQQAITNATWARHPELSSRPGESAAAYVARLKTLDLSDLPSPIAEAMRLLVQLHSASVLARVTGARLGDLSGQPTDRN
jgi:hypothetical protein